MQLPIVTPPRPKLLIDAGPSGEGWSSIESFIRCERLFYHQRIAGQDLPVGQPAATEPRPVALPLVRGAIGHVGLAHEYARRNARRHKLDPEMYYTADEAMTLAGQNWGMTAKTQDGITVEQILEEETRPTFHDYFKHYDGLREHLSVVAVETPLRATLANGKGISQRMDMITQDTDGRFWIYDHKFSSETYLPKLVARYSLSGQFLLMQHFGSAYYGNKFGGVRLNILCTRTNGRDGKPAKPEWRFRRFSPEPSPSALTEFPAVASRWRDRIDALKGQPMGAYLPAYNELVCVNNYEGRCSMYFVCQWGRDGAAT